MSDLQTKIDNATTQLAALNDEHAALAAENVTLEKESKALEHQAREKHVKRAANKERMQEISKAARELDAVLRHSKVQSDVQDAAAAAFQAKTDAEAAKAQAEASKVEQEAVLARLTEKEKRLDEIIAKAAASAESPPAA